MQGVVVVFGFVLSNHHLVVFQLYVTLSFDARGFSAVDRLLDCVDCVLLVPVERAGSFQHMQKSIRSRVVM